MPDKPHETSEDVRTWKRPDGLSLGDWIENERIARFESRTYDWNALKFQADYDPRYRRAQMRYIGLGAAGATVRRQCHSLRTLHVLDHGAPGRLRGSAARSRRRRGGVLHAQGPNPALHGA